MAGAVGVKLAMESNNVKVNIQGNEQRDAPVSRDGKTLNNTDVWVDRRTLIQIAKGVNGYERERWYTPGGLLEVGGYLGTTEHGIGEWASVGGIVTVAGGELVSRAGSQINISGGTLDVQSGYIRQSWLRGEDGRLYEISRAPGDLLYKGLYKGFEDVHARWGDKGTRYFHNPLIGPRQRYEEGYTAGRDAGQLVVSTKTAVLDGDIIGEAFQGVYQTQARQNIDAGVRQQTGYRQSQLARSLAGQLVIGGYQAKSFEQNGKVRWGYDLYATTGSISIQDGQPSGAPAVNLDDPLPALGNGRISLDASRLNGIGLGQITAVASESVLVKSRLRVANGGQIELYAPDVSIASDLSARSGRIAAGNVRRHRSGCHDSSGRQRVGPPDRCAGRTARRQRRVGQRKARSRDSRRPGISQRRTDRIAWHRGRAGRERQRAECGFGAAIAASGKLIGGRGGDVNVELALSPDGSAPAPVASASRSMARPMPMA